MRFSVRAFAVRDKAWPGKGIFALFSRRLISFSNAPQVARQCGEVVEPTMVVKDRNHAPLRVFAAYLCHNLHDSHVFDKLYEDPDLAGDIAGPKGHADELVIDLPKKGPDRL